MMTTAPTIRILRTGFDLLCTETTPD
jgi:hypothetical protein